MLSKRELCDILDSIYQLDQIKEVHPCLGCPSSQGDPEDCRGCADFDLYPGFHPIIEKRDPERIESDAREPGYKKFFKAFLG